MIFHERSHFATCVQFEIRSPQSTLNRSGYHTVDDLLTECKVQNNDRRHCDQHCCHLFRVIRCKLTLELSQCKRNGLQSDILDQNQSERELIPAAEYLNDRYRYQDRTADWENDIPQRMAEAASINGCCLLQTNRNRLYDALHQEDAHWKSKGYVWQKQGKPMV